MYICIIIIIIIIMDGVLGNDVVLFLCHLAEILSAGWKKSYGEVLGWIKV